jgi:drug/metabolite transporter (DMT)-like permease
MKGPNAGIAFMILATFIFAVQDGVSRHLAGTYNVWMIVMIRYWFGAALVLSLAYRSQGGFRARAKTKALGLQIFRGLLLAAEILIAVTAFVHLGLINTSAIFSSYPLMATLLSIPILAEVVGWRRMLATVIGFVGVMIIIKPGFGVFSVYALLPLVSAAAFALYGLMTRLVSRKDSSATSFFWTAVVGAAAMTPIGLWNWEPMATQDMGWMALLSLTAAAGHFSLIKSFELSEVNVVQPFAYLHMVFVAVIGVGIFGEELATNVIIGSGVVVAAGLFTLHRQQKRTPDQPSSTE